MKQNYKKLGDYIQTVNVRNTDLSVDTLLGVSVKKIFIPSIANTVGTNMKNYKIVRKNEFVYIADTSRRGDKIGIALLEDYDKAIVSQAYTVFEITKPNELDPQYLMMWFRRPEFDRYARYKSHGSVREVFDWDEMCEVELPIPSIEKQREIVNEYNTVVNRIKLNEQLMNFLMKMDSRINLAVAKWFIMRNWIRKCRWGGRWLCWGRLLILQWGNRQKVKVIMKLLMEKYFIKVVQTLVLEFQASEFTQQSQNEKQRKMIY